MSDGEVRLVRDGAAATVLFDRPQARNAMTWQMYEGLGAACKQLKSDSGIRVAVFRGVGGKAFIAGTDIAQFQSFTTAEQGTDYEAKMEAYLGAVEALPMPTLAVVEGWAIGGGLAIAACCDLRIATTGSKFGVPIARTLGNCLSVANYARLVANLGVARAKRMLLMAENIPAEDALGRRLPDGRARFGSARCPHRRNLRTPARQRPGHHARHQGSHPALAARKPAGRRRSCARLLWQRRLPYRRQSVCRKAAAAMARPLIALPRT
ncbi:MAG: enoyl-CoA hydratase-related protein [Pseudolabrys sp.]